MFTTKMRIKLMICAVLLTALGVLAPEAVASCLLEGGYPCYCYSVNSPGYAFCFVNGFNQCSADGSCY
jgi:hypothetical protein